MNPDQMGPYCLQRRRKEQTTVVTDGFRVKMCLYSKWSTYRCNEWCQKYINLKKALLI